MKKYIPKETETKWQKRWEDEGLYVAQDGDKESRKGKYYVLDMFPYPSGDGLHVGHFKGYTATDVVSRFLRAKGFNVLHPMGWDAFGLPAENYAIKTGIHPKITTAKNISHIREQMKMVGLSYDWQREIDTTDPNYYEWTQWIFLQLYKKGLAYEAEAPINWCPKDKTGLANEEVVDGCCDRCGTKVVRKKVRQWVLAITKYADKLLDGLDGLDWPESIREMQRNWIGRSEGSQIEFKIQNSKFKINVFTTRADTLFGATYAVLAPEHNLVGQITTPEQKKTVDAYVKKAPEKTDLQRTALEKEKTGVFTGAYVINPVNGEQIPVWIADYVLESYGTGAIMAVPAHDERDFEFAKKYDLSIRSVVKPKNENIVIVHGCPRNEQDATNLSENSRDKHWINWLRRELKKQGENVVVPIFPRAWEPVYEDWKREFEKIEVSENSTLIGHSCGCAFLARWLAETGRRVKKLILVAPAKIPKEDATEVRKKFYDFEIPSDLREQVGESVIFLSNDEKRIIESAELYKNALSARIVKVKNKGHFILEHMEGEEFGELLEEISRAASVNVQYGMLVNSGKYNGLTSEEAKEKITRDLEKDGKANFKVSYKLRDWIFSRQRYWGEPIPIIFCRKCWENRKQETINNKQEAINLKQSSKEEFTVIDGVEYAVIPVPEEDLPVLLPEVDKYQPTGTGESPLASIDKWVNVKCPNCGGDAKRETNTMPQWAGSCWYYLRFIDPKNDTELVGKSKEAYWMGKNQKDKVGGVDWYVGGAEHAVLHLLYARFWHKFLFDIGIVSTEEPFYKLRNVGLIMGPDGQKMSKSRGNVISPEEMVKSYGADTLRLFEMFIGPFGDVADWKPTAVEGVYRFLQRVWMVSFKVTESGSEKSSVEAERQINRTIKKIEEDIWEMKFNTSVASMMEFVNFASRNIDQVGIDSLGKFLQILAPFAPHIAEELYQQLFGSSKFEVRTSKFNSVHSQPWPEWDEKMIEGDTVTIVVQVNGKVRGSFEIEMGADQQVVEQKAKELPKVKEFMAGKDPIKIIFVADKLVNFVV